MSREFHQLVWDRQLQQDWQDILRLAIREDMAGGLDVTTEALVPEDAIGSAILVARQSGVLAGLPGVEMALHLIEPRLQFLPRLEDGQPARAGDRIATLEGPARGMLMAERLVLNLLGRLSGIATITRRYVEAVQGTNARIYDTRKTTPGWRRLEKYAVRCGGGWNHRTGLFDAVLIKDNHLALGAELPHTELPGYGPADAVARARQFVGARTGDSEYSETLVEVEVDGLEQLDEVLSAGPDIVLLDNMTPDQLTEAVARRDALGPAVELEASGGVTLETARQIAASGVERISVGGLTHSATWLDVGLDWTRSRDAKS